MSSHFGIARALSLATLGTLSGIAAATPPTDREELNEVVVTAARMQAPLLVETDARAPRQPVPAHDGADDLKTVPGFSVIRKGGTDGDPVFRGMAASRVNVQIDGEQVLGGCGMRMDPPTAYVFPEAYDRIVVVKGPQTVLRGPGNSAATTSSPTSSSARRASTRGSPARAPRPTSTATAPAAKCTPATGAGAAMRSSAGRPTSRRASS